MTPKADIQIAALSRKPRAQYVELQALNPETVIELANTVLDTLPPSFKVPAALLAEVNGAAPRTTNAVAQRPGQVISMKRGPAPAPRN